MKKFGKIIFIYFLLNLISQVKSEAMKCDQVLLSTFKLRGLKYSISDQMHICQNVHERCCTLFDEIEILKLWNDGALNQINSFLSNIMRHYEIIISFHKYFVDLKEEDVVFHYISFKRTPYLHKIGGNRTWRLRENRFHKFINVRQF